MRRRLHRPGRRGGVRSPSTRRRGLAGLQQPVQGGLFGSQVVAQQSLLRAHGCDRHLVARTGRRPLRDLPRGRPRGDLRERGGARRRHALPDPRGCGAVLGGSLGGARSVQLRQRLRARLVAHVRRVLRARAGHEGGFAALPRGDCRRDRGRLRRGVSQSVDRVLASVSLQRIPRPFGSFASTSPKAFIRPRARRGPASISWQRLPPKGTCTKRSRWRGPMPRRFAAVSAAPSSSFSHATNASNSGWSSRVCRSRPRAYGSGCRRRVPRKPRTPRSTSGTTAPMARRPARTRPRGGSGNLPGQRPPFSSHSPTQPPVDDTLARADPTVRTLPYVCRIVADAGK